MTFSPRSLVRQGTPVPVGSTAGNPQEQQVSFFLYATDDAAATVEASDYFLAAYQQLKKGDVITAAMVHSGSVVAKIFRVTASSASTVTIGVASVTAA